MRLTIHIDCFYSLLFTIFYAFLNPQKKPPPPYYLFQSPATKFRIIQKPIENKFYQIQNWLKFLLVIFWRSKNIQKKQAIGQ